VERFFYLWSGVPTLWSQLMKRDGTGCGWDAKPYNFEFLWKFSDSKPLLDRKLPPAVQLRSSGYFSRLVLALELPSVR